MNPPTACVLLVEDDLPSAYLARFLLEAAGFTVDEQHDGSEGVVAAMQARPDLILMDLMLPGMDGLEATRTLREVYGMDLPIVALSAHASRMDRDAAMAAGCSGFITKPIDPATFVDAVRGFMDPQAS